jgi:hypothetical protein
MRYSGRFNSFRKDTNVKAWILIAASFVVGCLAQAALAQQKVKTDYKSDTVLPIMFRGCEGVQANGSCTLIERSLVLTAGHVVGGSIAEVTFRGQTVLGKVIALDLFHDRALVRLEKELDAKPRKFRLTDLSEGESIFAIGYGSGFGYTPGRAAGGKLRGRSVPGDSGGLIADSKGEIVGIVQGYASDGELYGHGRKSILEWVQANKGNDPIDLGNR